MLTVTTFHKVVANPPTAMSAPRTTASGARPIADAPGRADARRQDKQGNRAHAPGEHRVDQAADHAAGGRRRQQQPVPAHRHVQRLGREQHERGRAHLARETAHRQQDRDDPQQPVPGQPAQPGGAPPAGLGFAASLLVRPGRERGSPLSSAADPANDATSTANGATGASANSALPTGGPRNEPPITCTTYWVPFALGSRSFGTSDGSTDWAALSKTTCALPRQSPAAASVQMLMWWTATRHGDHGDDGALDKLSPPHQCRPVAAVNQRAGRQRHQQPRQVGRHRDGRDQHGIPGETDREQRQCRGERPVAGVIHGVGPPQPPVGRA